MRKKRHDSSAQYMIMKRVPGPQGETTLWKNQAVMAVTDSCELYIKVHFNVKFNELYNCIVII